MRWNAWKMRGLALLAAAALAAAVCACGSLEKGAHTEAVNAEYIADAFAGNAVNVSVFRKDAATTAFREDGSRVYFCAFYDEEGTVCVAKKEWKTENDSMPWEILKTPFSGNIADAHNTVSIMADGCGYLHMAFSNHNGKLIYAKSAEPFSAELSGQTMIGTEEEQVTYPEFYLQPSGDLFFLYREGVSGNGHVLLNHYDAKAGKWTRLHSDLISGEGKTSPYWQACTDDEGRLHISWTWRETSDVNTNHDICYAVTADETGTSFTDSDGDPYTLPITEGSAEVVREIPQGSLLINQTSMAADHGEPYIVSWWRENGIVQYFILRKKAGEWQCFDTGIRTTDFSLDGRGTKALPCARPQILLDYGSAQDPDVLLLLRDEETGDRPLLARLTLRDGFASSGITVLSARAMGEWEPLYDSALWKKERELHLVLLPASWRKDNAPGTKEREALELLTIELE